MMQKLTQEQANYLIDLIDNASLRVDGAFKNEALELRRQIIESLNQYTKKEFPKVIIRNEPMAIRVIENTCTPNVVCIQIIDERDKTAFEGSIGLEFKEFLQFVEGVNKIADWIREQR